MYQLVFGMLVNLTIDSADNPGGNLGIIQEDEKLAKRQLYAGEHVLTRVRREEKRSPRCQYPAGR